MKKFLLIASILLLTVLIGGCQNPVTPATALQTPAPQKQPTRWDEIIKTGELKIGVPSLSDSMDNRLIDAFSEETNLTVSKVVLPWDDTLETAVTDGTVDMLWGQIPAISESSTMFRLSNPYFHSTMLYLSRSEELTVDQNTTAGVLKHSAGQFMAENYFASTKVYNTRDELFYGLSSGQVACVLYDNALFENMQTKKDAFHIVKEVPYDLVVAFEQNNVSVATEVEKLIAKIKADGTASDICLKWYLNDYIKK
ncbi:MAG: transporter substrate-binding domain-containing protein [Clostridia bacterium]|nr:transporter substrate-binding domain-containing protein [Clostridia bacterium]